MAVPTPVVGALNELTSAGTTITVQYPATVAAGSIAYLFVAGSTNSLTTNPAGFTQLVNFSNTANTVSPSLYIGRKVCAGTEGGTGVPVTTPSTTRSGIMVVVPPGADTGTPEDFTAVIADNSSASTAAGNAGGTVVTAGSAGLYFTTNNTGANTTTETTGYTQLSTRVAGSRAFSVGYKTGLSAGATGALSDTYSGSGKSDTAFIVVRASVAATFSSANNTAFTKGSPGTFSVTVTGASPTAVLTQSGSLPTGVTWTDNGNNTATLAGTPTQSGTFPLTLTATNAGGAPTQSFTLTVNDAPAITSANSSSGTQSSAYTFTVTTTGFPTNTITKSGTLPTGVTLTDNGNNTATIAGTPSNNGSFPITITAHNGIGSDATQSHTITIASSATVATFSSASSTSFVEHAAGTFTVTTTGGSPTPVLTKTGSLPSGVTFTDNGNGTATIAGTSALKTVGAYPITITATNSAGAPTQSFTLNITAFAPTLTSEELVHALNRVAGTSNLAVTGAANAWAGTTGLELLGALNAKNGTSGIGLLGVLNQLAGTTNLDINGASRNLH